MGKMKAFGGHPRGTNRRRVTFAATQKKSRPLAADGLG
jgi:hypothetical protein